MPRKPLRPCKAPLCRNMSDASFCPEHRRERRRTVDRRRGTPAERGYGKEWRAVIRPFVLNRDPLCKLCNEAPSTEVDHIIPLDPETPVQTFDEHGRRLLGTHDVENLQGLCSKCHKTKTLEENRAGGGRIRRRSHSSGRSR